MLRYYLGIDPTGLSDAEWAAEIARLRDLRQRESKAFKGR